MQNASRPETLRPIPRDRAAAALSRPELAALIGHVMDGGARSAGRMMATLSRPRHATTERALAAAGLVPDADLVRIRAARTGLPFIDPQATPADRRLALRYGIGPCLRDGVLPWSRAPAATTVLVDDPDRFARLRPALEAVFGPVLPALAPHGAIQAALLAEHGATLAEQAETRVAPRESCRSFDGRRLMPLALGLGLLFLLGLALFPATVLGGLVALALAALWANTLLKAMALAAAVPDPDAPPAALPAPAHPDLLPEITILVALYGEAEIAPRLVRRLERLDYPRHRLELLLVVEEEDTATRDALATADLPDWMRVVVCPAGRVKTKPRALNVALAQSSGSIVGVYDAEDAPAPDQLLKVAAHFAQAAPDVACLQGVLDFYNARTNAMSRAFALEYAGWFRLMLPGFQRLGLVMPLGGTTLFFRRTALEGLGAWDAHNVTEDADLGLRLARHGWRTEMLDSATLEEANCAPLSWVRQRSRWIKGYLMTWAVHMRAPAALWRALGTRRFLAVQAQFALSVLQALLAPCLWAFWLLGSGGGAGLLPAFPPLALAGLVALLVGAFALDLSIALVARKRAGLGFSPLWVVALPLYHMLATAASVKAVYELFLRPFHWDKTRHGRFGG